jgi:hypothetical protein
VTGQRIEDRDGWRYSVGLVVALAEGGGSFCHCEPVVVVEVRWSALQVAGGELLVWFASSHKSRLGA